MGGSKTSRWWTVWGLLILVWAAFPMLWMVSLSFKDPSTFRSSTPTFRRPKVKSSRLWSKSSVPTP